MNKAKREDLYAYIVSLNPKPDWGTSYLQEGLRRHDESLKNFRGFRPTVLKSWVTNLRSPAYPQDPDRSGGLFNPVTYGYCCLGVLAHGTFNINNTHLALPGYMDKYFLADLPEWVAAHENNSWQRFFAYLNDTLRLRFDQIADVIEMFFEYK